MKYHAHTSVTIARSDVQAAAPSTSNVSASGRLKFSYAGIINKPLTATSRKKPSRFIRWRSAQADAQRFYLVRLSSQAEVSLVRLAGTRPRPTRSVANTTVPIPSNHRARVVGASQAERLFRDAPVR
jgi:hypothetical protein